MDPVTASTVLTILGTAFGVMFATMTSLMFVSIRVQHREGRQNRDLIEEVRKENQQARIENRDLIAEIRKENRDLIEQARIENREQFGEIRVSLADARERLARIEGHLGVVAPARGNAASGAESSDAA